MRHFVTLFIPLLIATTSIGCGGSDNTPTDPTQPTPVAITISFSDGSKLTVKRSRIPINQGCAEDKTFSY